MSKIMTRSQLLTRALVACALFGLGACSDPDPTPEPTPDMAADMSGDMSADMPGDLGGDMADMTTPQACALQADCPSGQVCANQQCVKAPSCQGVAQWERCKEKLDELEPGLGAGAICQDTTCVIKCMRDDQCPGDQVCMDDGECVDFTSDLSAPAPGGQARAALQAGVGEALMRYPIGLSMAGYGLRGDGDGRYVASLGPSHGQLEGLYARAVVLDNGERELMLIRLPIIFPTFQLHEAVARYLQEKTGKNWRGSLLISGTHSHSGPARYYPLPEETLLAVGSFGTDDYHDEAFGWLLDATTEAAQAAIDDKRPGRIGWTILESFDMDDEVSSDRWEQTPSFDDNRVLLMRVDDDQGVPRAVLFSLGTHGTFNDSDYYTSDAMGGMEHMLERRLGQEHGRVIPAMYFNQNGGTMSPRGDRHGHSNNEKFEQIGYRFVQKTWDTIATMETKTDVSLGGVTRRFPLSYELLGYAPDEFTDLLPARQELVYGGLQCSQSGNDDRDPTTYTAPTDVRCLGVHRLLYNRPPTTFLRTQLSAFEIDGLTIVTMPGELSMELGWEVLRDVSDTYSVDPFTVFTMGYAQDHNFYLTPTNLRGRKPPFPGVTLPMAPDDYPDFAFSTLQGGYEGGFSPWGYRMGDFLISRAIEAVGLLRGQPVELGVPEVAPEQRAVRGNAPFPIDVHAPDEIATITQDVPAQIKRLEQLTFSWIGGDPGAELPQAPRVILERVEGDGSITAIETPSKRPYDNRRHLFITRLRKAPLGWEWLASWEELEDFPTGRYRLRVEGHYQAQDGRKAYEVISSTFEVVGADVIITQALDGATLRGTLAYPASQEFRMIRQDGDPGFFTGNYRMRHPDVPTGVTPPVEVGADLDASDAGALTVQLVGDGGTFTFNTTQLGVVTAQETVAGRAGVPVTRFAADLSAVPAGAYTLTVTVTDRYGNQQTLTEALTRP